MVDKTQKQLVQQQFGPTAAAYSSSAVHGRGKSLLRLLELVKAEPGWTALDLATGAGHTALAFAPAIGYAVATDLTHSMLLETGNLAREKGIANCFPAAADVDNLPFPGRHFDLVTCRLAPHHFPSIERFLGECKRVLKPSGVLAVVDNIVPADEQAAAYVNAYERKYDPSHVGCLSTEAWQVAFMNAGFRIEHVETILKVMDFEAWAGRKGLAPPQKAGLLEMLAAAPHSARNFLNPELETNPIRFTLTEGVIVGRL